STTTPARWCWSRMIAICWGWYATASGAWPTAPSIHSRATWMTMRAGCVDAVASLRSAAMRKNNRPIRASAVAKPRRCANASVPGKHLENVEARMAKVDAALSRLQERLADPAIYEGPTAVLADIGREQNALRGEKATLEAEWLERYEALETALP